MRILRAEAHNFLSFECLKYEYAQQGLTLIEGPTGVGKSSFLDVVSYGLFGQISKNVAVEEIINRKVGKNLFVQIELEYLGKHYSIVRTRKHSEFGNDLVLVVNGVQNRGKNMLETDKIIQQTFGLNFDVFQKATYFSQFSKIDSFLSSSDTAKKELISDICGLGKYDEILDKSKQLCLQLEKDIAVASSACRDKESNLSLIKSTLQSIEANKSTWIENQKIKIALLENQCKAFEENKQKSIDSAIQQQKRYEDFRLQTIAELSGQKERFEAERMINISNCEAEIAKQKSQVSAYQKEISDNTPKPRDFSAEKQEVVKRLSVITDLQLKKDSLNGNIAFNQKSVSSLGSQVHVENSKLNAGENSSCPTCYQQISSTLIKEKISSLNAQIQEHKLSIAQLQNSVAMVDQGIQQKPQIEAELQSINSQEAAHYLWSSKVKQLQDFIAIAERNILSSTKELEHHKTCSNPIDSKIELEKAKPNPFDRELDLARAQVNIYTSQLENEKKVVHPFDAQIADVNAKTVDCQTKLDEAVRNFNSLEKRFKYAKWWKEAFGVYIRSYLMDSFISQINDKSNEYLNVLFDGVLQINIESTTEAGKETKEKISINIYNSGDECSYDSLSGGERCRICLAVNLAISDLACQMNQSSFNILMMDEIFNGLDENGKNQTMKLLKELEPKFDTIFVIDHTEAFKSMFTNTIAVEKRGGVSCLVQAV